MVNKPSLFIKHLLQQLWSKEIPQREISSSVRASASERRERLAKGMLESLRNPANHNKTK